MGERREAKKRETRQRISDVATGLFCERGFDAVTLDEIALAAGVSKMTVFNYFARKEDLMLDRRDDLLLLPWRAAIRDRPAGQSPVDALRAHVDGLRAQPHPFVRLDRRALVWWRVVAASPALKARLHELEDEAAEGLAVELGGAKPDGLARLTAGLLVATVRAAREEAVRLLARGVAARQASEALLALMERGLAAVQQLASGPG